MRRPGGLQRAPTASANLPSRAELRTADRGPTTRGRSRRSRSTRGCSACTTTARTRCTGQAPGRSGCGMPACSGRTSSRHRTRPNWTRLDTSVTEAHANGTEVTLVLGLTPKFVRRDPTDPAYATSMPDLDMYRAVRPRRDGALQRRQLGLPRHRGVPGLERGQHRDVLDRYQRRARPAGQDRARRPRPGRPRCEDPRPGDGDPAEVPAERHQELLQDHGGRQARLEVRRRRLAQPLPARHLPEPEPDAPRHAGGLDGPAVDRPRDPGQGRRPEVAPDLEHRDQLRPAGSESTAASPRPRSRSDDRSRT